MTSRWRYALLGVLAVGGVHAATGLATPSSGQSATTVAKELIEPLRLRARDGNVEPMKLETRGMGSGTIRLNGAQGSRRRVIHVDDDAEPGGAGRGGLPFDDIADSPALAASLGGAVVVLEPGRYPVSSTLHVQSPVGRRGSNVMEVDDAGRPTGPIVPGTETGIVGTAALGPALLSFGSSASGVIQGVQARLNHTPFPGATPASMVRLRVCRIIPCTTAPSEGSQATG